MTAAWSPAELQEINAARELEIASRRADGTLRRWVPIWAVSTGGLVYVRTWYRRETGWFGRVLASRRARIRVPGLEADVEVEDVTDPRYEWAEVCERRFGRRPVQVFHEWTARRTSPNTRAGRPVGAR
jgi:hypothetical protein